MFHEKVALDVDDGHGKPKAKESKGLSGYIQSSKMLSTISRELLYAEWHIVVVS